MSKLIKNVATSYIPGNPGVPGSPYIPPQPERVSVEQQTTCEWSDMLQNIGGEVYLFSAPIQLNCVTNEVIVYHPPVAAQQAVPYSPPTPDQIIVALNQGWNSHAKTVDRLDPESWFRFTVKLGTHGAFIAIGSAGMEGQPLSSFPNAMMVDTSGVYVVEYGQIVETLPLFNAPGREFRIGRLADSRIAYSSDGYGIISSEQAYDDFDELFVYGMLYSGYDEVSDASFVQGALADDDAIVSLSGVGSFSVAALPLAYLDGAGALDVMISTAVIFDGYGTLEAELSDNASVIGADIYMDGSGSLVAHVDVGGYGYANLPQLSAFGGDNDAPGFGYGVLPTITGSGKEAELMPATPTAGYGNLPFLVGFASGSDLDVGQGAGTLPYLVGQAAEGEYGIGSGTLRSVVGYAWGEINGEDELQLVSGGIANSRHAAKLDLFMVLNSTGQLSSLMTLTRDKALQLLSELHGSNSFELLGVFGFNVLSDMAGMSLQTANINNLPDILEGGVVWVVNTDTRASSQYDGFGFNSFFRRDGVYYGVANDGVYRLDGDDDAGEKVEALAYIGKLDLATALKKVLPSAYIGASSTGKLQLEVDADGSVYVYETRSSDDGTFKQHRVDLGRGLKANMLGLTIKNKNGDDFEISSFDLLATPATRRI